MPFIPRLPTWNSSITYYRLQTTGVWVADITPMECQFYFGERIFQLTWIDEYQTTRGAAGTKHWQTAQYNIFLLVPKEATPRDPLDVRVASGKAFGARDYFEYTNTYHGVRQYWVDQVDPRWPDFPNEHKIIVATRRGYNP